MIQMPPDLEKAWHTHGYYGSVSHNVKAIYQRYVGWYDGNPAHLWLHPPQEAAARYVKVLGGVRATVGRAKEFLDEGDLRFAAELASHAVFADPSDRAARELLATAFDRLAYGSENATWRNAYLTGALELRGDIQHMPVSGAGLAAAMTITQLFDSVAIRIVGTKAWDQHVAINWHFTDVGEHYRMELSNGVLIHYPTAVDHDADLAVTLTKPVLLQMLAGAGHPDFEHTGDPSVLLALLALTDSPNTDFPIVTP
jgi:alkyl sulfatase BDS1-like metallo-beta-lactamase superfamily hydrolase